MAPKRPAARAAPAAAAAPPPQRGDAVRETYDVVVVGGGPVGVFAANLLGGYGVRTLLLERDTGMYAAPRAVAVDDETTRLLGLAHPGLAAWMDAHVYKAPIDLRSGPPPAAAACLGPPGQPPSPAQLAAFVPGWSLVGPLPPRAIDASGGAAEFAFHHQPSLERRLRHRLASGALGGAVTVRLGCEVTAVTERRGGGGGGSDSGPPVVVTARDVAAGGGGAVSHYGAAFVVAADGGSSPIRKGLGIPFEGSSFGAEPWMVIDLESDDPALAAAYPCFNFMNAWDASAGVTRCVVHVPLPGPRAARRFEFLLEPHEDPASMTTPARQAELLASVGVHAARVSVTRCLVYTFHARVAAAWRAGRVFLAGDAAHCMPPFRGQGMCTGLRDAANLAWKLATAVRLAPAACRGVGGGVLPPGVESLLDAYRPERYDHLRATTDIAVTIGSLVQVRRPALLRHGRNAVVGGLYRFPLTRPFFLEPFAPPTALHAGVLDLAAGDGEGVATPAPPSLAWTLAAAVARGVADGLRLRPLTSAPGGTSGNSGGRAPGWRARDAVVGTSVPNAPVELVHDGAAVKLPLDALLCPWREEGEGDCGAGGGSGSSAPLWHVLVPPRLSGGGVTTIGDGSSTGQPTQQHPLEVLTSLRSAAEARAAGDAGDAALVPLLSSFVGVQLLPVTGAPSRIRAHALRQWAALGIDDGGVRVELAAPGAGASVGKAKGGSRRAAATAQPTPTPAEASAAPAHRRAYIVAAYRGVVADAVREARLVTATCNGGDGYLPFGGCAFHRADGLGGGLAGAALLVADDGSASSSSSSAVGGTGKGAGAAATRARHLLAYAGTIAGATAGDVGGSSSTTTPPHTDASLALADVAAADASGKLGLWFAAHGDAAAVVVRPDRVVYGAYASAGELAAALTQLAAALGGEGTPTSPSPPSLLRRRRSAAADWLRWLVALVVTAALLAAVFTLTTVSARAPPVAAWLEQLQAALADALPVLTGGAQ